MPQVIDRRDLGEESVPAEVEAPTVSLHRAGDASDLVPGLDDRRRDAELVQLERGSQPRRARADDDDLRIARSRRDRADAAFGIGR